MMNPEETEDRFDESVGDATHAVIAAFEWAGLPEGDQLGSLMVLITRRTNNLGGNMPGKVLMICGQCGSEDVTVEAVVEWSREQQQWETTDVLDQSGFCADCGRNRAVTEKSL